MSDSGRKACGSAGLANPTRVSSIHYQSVQCLVLTGLRSFTTLCFTSTHVQAGIDGLGITNIGTIYKNQTYEELVSKCAVAPLQFPQTAA